ncbi:hypothetical protein ACEPPN_017057 [Leptodophora sp. 'Broadleaf-Isolate-01']
MQLLKSFTLAALLPLTHARPHDPYTFLSTRQNKIPTTTIAGVIVPNTPLVIAAKAYARAHSDDMTYNHVMRSWLYGSIIISKNTTLNSLIDPETHAIAAILHDLGWDNTGALISSDKRFEVDGAIAARDFVDAAVKNGTTKWWDEGRKQLVWDAIALHTDPTIFQYKEPVVKATGTGIFSDFQGPNSDLSHTLTWDEYYRVKEAFPRLDLGPSVGEIICGFARTKPATTYDNWMMQYGIRYVKNYTEEAKGHLGIDMVEGSLPN